MAERESSALPASGLAVMVALLFGYVAVHESTLERYRPVKTEKSSDQVIDLQDADARLWQDPFAAAQRHHEELQKLLEGGKPTEWTQRHADRHHFHSLRKEIGEALKKNPVTILGVTVPSAPYAEDVERRQRNRYATLAGLNREAFAPDNGDHIGYVLTRGGDPTEKCPRDIELLPEKIPYEWFSAGTERPQEPVVDGKPAQRRVLVMWLSESALGKQPLKSLAALTGCLGVTAQTSNLSIRVLGPSSSDTLRTMVAENSALGWSTGPHIQIYSPNATAASEALLEGLGKEARIPVCQPSGIPHQGDVCVVRTIVTDEKLAKSIVIELEKRGVSLRPECIDRNDPSCTGDRVALISEWDTFYGRSLPDAIGKVLCPKSPRQCDAVLRKSYLQGIDGTVPGENAGQPSGGASAKADQKDVTKETARGERADGRHQFDYLRRLTDDVRQQNAAASKGELKAIGILGSDVYDKLLVLQALRSAFPQAQFFTTDVDARLLHPQEFKWARNIVAASGFGLQLRKELQGDIPPFRDTYQTSLFLSAILALAPDTRVPDQKQLDERKLLPRIFETGRRHAYALDRDHATGACDRYRPLDCGSVHPDSPDFVPPAIRNGWMYIPAFLLLLVLAMPLYSAYRRRPAADLSKRLPATAEDEKAGIMSRIPVDVVGMLLERRRARALAVFALTSLALVPVLHLAVLLLLDRPFNEEPLAFYEGISLWPTEALRIYSGVLAIFLTYWAMLRMEKNQVELTGWFFPKCRTLGIPEFDFNRQGLWTSILSNLQWENLKRIIACDLLEGQKLDTPDTRLNAEKFWREYVFHSSLPASAIRTTLAATAFLLFSMSLLWVLGIPHTPYRGEFSLIADRIAVLAWSTPLLLFLTFYVLDATLLCKRFVAALTDRHTQWPDDTRKHYGAVTGGDTKPGVEVDEAYDDWVDIRLIAERTAAISSLVYYPLVVMIVLLFARSTLFDTWHWPAGLVVPLGVSLIILFACHIALRRQAEAARSIALAKVARRLLVAKGEGAAAAARASQLELMLGNIVHIREGAFALITQQPLVKALLIFVSASGLAILEYFGIISF
jgi:hypothetical protein